MNPVGIMQGRLSPPVDGRIQAFPANTWKDEFQKAAAIGFNEIEFIFESPNYENNPLFTSEGLNKIREMSGATGVQVNYVCADYFMGRPFFRAAERDRKQSVEILKHLIEQCAKIGVKGVEIPLVDNSRIETREETKLLMTSLRECLPVAEACNIRLPLETSLKPDDFKELLEEINHPLIRANCDTGNSASLGFDPREEILKLGPWLDNVHIKDRVRGGGTVPLGEGDADFDQVFAALGKVGYPGSLILQAARGDNELETAGKYLAFVRRYVGKYLE